MRFPALKALNKPLVSSFNKWKSYYSAQRGQKHCGTDIYGATGDPLIACWSGRITRLKNGGDWGLNLGLTDSRGIMALYAHCNDVDVKLGQTVTEGQLIAEVGSTGFTFDSPHLHNEYWRDPLNWLSAFDNFAELKAAYDRDRSGQPPIPMPTKEELEMAIKTAGFRGDPNRVDYLHRDGDKSAIHAFRQGERFFEEDLGGQILEPVDIFHEGDRMTIVGVGTDYRLWKRVWNGRDWEPWTKAA